MRPEKLSGWYDCTRTLPYHVSRDRQERGIVNFTDISTDDNLADIMTKALGPDKHQHFATGVGLCLSWHSFLAGFSAGFTA